MTISRMPMTPPITLLELEIKLFLTHKVYEVLAQGKLVKFNCLKVVESSQIAGNEWKKFFCCSTKSIIWLIPFFKRPIDPIR